MRKRHPDPTKATAKVGKATKDMPEHQQALRPLGKGKDLGPIQGQVIAAVLAIKELAASQPIDALGILAAIVTTVI